MVRRRTRTSVADAPDREVYPAPLPGGVEHLESLGRFIDNLMGDARDRRKARRALAAMGLPDELSPEDVPETEPPEPLPGGTEPFTRGVELPETP